MTDRSDRAGGDGVPEESDKFDEWIRALDEDVIQGEFGYEEGEFTVYTSHWRPSFDEGLTPREAWMRALDGYANARRDADAAKTANYARIVSEDQAAVAREQLKRASPPSGNAGEAEQMVREGRAITVIIPTGYHSAWDFLHDCGLEAVYAAPPQPAPDAVRQAVREQYAQAISDATGLQNGNIYKAADAILSLQSTGDQQPQPPPSPCRRYVNGDAEMVCKCVNGKYPEVVDMEWHPPTCKAVASHDGGTP